jgi:hypothetical protein
LREEDPGDEAQLLVVSVLKGVTRINGTVARWRRWCSGKTLLVSCLGEEEKREGGWRREAWERRLGGCRG